MHNLRMNFFRYIQRLKQYSISTSAKHMLSTVIGVLLTSNILSVVLIVLLHNYIATELVGFLCALAAITAIATLLLIFTVCALDDMKEKISSTKSDEGSLCASVMCGIGLALAIFMFVLARLIMLVQCAGGMQ